MLDVVSVFLVFFFQAEDGIRDAQESRGLGDVYKRQNLNEAISMAGTLISILPLLIFYFIFQRWFVQSVDKTGITGE